MIVVRPPTAAGDHQYPPPEWSQHSRLALSKPGEENIKICIKTDEYSSQSQTKPRKLEPLVHKIPMGGRNNLAGLRLPANYSGEVTDVLTLT